MSLPSLSVSEVCVRLKNHLEAREWGLLSFFLGVHICYTCVQKSKSPGIPLICSEPSMDFSFHRFSFRIFHCVCSTGMADLVMQCKSIAANCF